MWGCWNKNSLLHTTQWSICKNLKKVQKLAQIAKIQIFKKFHCSIRQTHLTCITDTQQAKCLSIPYTNHFARLSGRYWLSYPDVWTTRQASNLTFCNWLRFSNNSSLQSPSSNSGHHTTLVPKLQAPTSYLVKMRDDVIRERMFTFGFVWNIAGGWLLDSVYPFSSMGDFSTQWRF